ncbi:MAG: hypothetical protein JSU00_12310 [Acidobacteria bacterium]|nr:hypothetical protein [Acidobacteriota bacterium]
MKSLILTILLAAAVCSAGDKKSRPTGEAGNENVDIYATPLLDRDQIKEAVGAEMPAGIIAVRVRIVPRGEQALSVSRDDFEIISHKDGQRSGAFGPTQIAGNATMVVRTVAGNDGMYSGNPNGPVWGGIPGTMGRPRQMPGGGGAVGSGTSGTTEAEAKTQEAANKKENPLVAILADKMLQDKETKEALSGLLYFPLEGKQKLKDIELIYKGPAGRLIVPFAFK